MNNVYIYIYIQNIYIKKYLVVENKKVNIHKVSILNLKNFLYQKLNFVLQEYNMQI